MAAFSTLRSTAESSSSSSLDSSGVGAMFEGKGVSSEKTLDFFKRRTLVGAKAMFLSVLVDKRTAVGSLGIPSHVVGSFRLETGLEISQLDLTPWLDIATPPNRQAKHTALWELHHLQMTTGSKLPAFELRDSSEFRLAPCCQRLLSLRSPKLHRLTNRVVAGVSDDEDVKSTTSHIASERFRTTKLAASVQEKQPSSQLKTENTQTSAEANRDELLRELDSVFNYEGRIQSPSTCNDKDHRCGFVSIIGAPNMGKSTLLNSLLQEDLCIATHKPQTTRHAIIGILSTNTSQVCLVDTPGVIETPAYKLQEGMMEAVVGAFHDADVLLVVTDVFSTPIPSDKLFQCVQASRKPVIVAINKIDLSQSINPYDASDHVTIAPEQAVSFWRQLLPNAVAILPVTASGGPKDPGVAALRSILTDDPNTAAAIRGLGRPIPGMLLDPKQVPSGLLPPSPPLYDSEHLTDKTERFIASEMIRAALLESLHAELPYCCEVEVTSFRDGDEEIDIQATIMVERDSQKGIVVGKRGSQIGSIRRAAVKKLEEFFVTKVVLHLMVKVDKDWRKDADRLRQYGYLKKKKKS